MSMAFLACATALAGCGSGDESGMNGDPGAGVVRQHPSEPIEIQESDIIRLNGDRLYVMNRQRGLGVIDVSEPRAPVLVTRLEVLAGKSGELYVHGDALLALVEDSGLPCHGLAPAEYAALPSTAVSLIEGPATNPKVVADRCVPGSLVTSRLVGDVLYVVTRGGATESERGWLFSFDASRPSELRVVESLELGSGTPEVLVTESAAFIAERAGTSTRVRTIDISAGDGSLVERGSITVPGHAPSRFHLDARDGTFRIVTRDPTSRMTQVFVVDVSRPERLAMLSALQSIARGEELFATRFIGDRAYIVTYQPEVVVNRVVERPGNDPLWVVSLEDPLAPVVLGRLEIPGWSDYVFPRGDLLFAVGRGAEGNRVAASLFDVRDPTRPKELRRVEFGADRASSEAATDFRAVEIIDGALGAPALAVVPYSNNFGVGAACSPEHHLQLIELGERDLKLRGSLQLDGRVLRGLAVGEALYGVTTRVVAAIDTSDRDRPSVDETVLVGDPGVREACVIAPEPPREVITEFRTDGEGPPGHPWACGLTGRGVREGNAGFGLWALVALVALAVMGRRRARSGTRPSPAHLEVYR